MRLHLIGIPSAGKTTLGEGVARLLDVPFHALDGLAFVDERWTLRPAEERAAMVAAILAEPSFVTEGGFLGWTDPLLEAADHIVWLDPPLRTLVWRHVLRHGRHPTWLPSLLRFQVRMYVRPAGSGPLASDPDQTRPGIAVALRPWRHKVFRVTGGVTPAELVASLRTVGR